MPTPDQLSGLRLWLKADAITGLNDGDPVTTWSDSSGQANNATQATAAKKPTYKTGILSGKPVVRFDGVDDELTLGDLSAYFPSAATLFVVVILSSDAAYSIYGTAANDGFWRWDGDGKGYMGAFRATRIAGYPATMPQTGTRFFELRSSASGYRLYQDGLALGDEQAAGYAGGANHRIGNNADAAADRFLAGDVAEIIVYDSAFSDANRGIIRDYVNSKYALGLPITEAGMAAVAGQFYSNPVLAPEIMVASGAGPARERS